MGNLKKELTPNQLLTQLQILLRSAQDQVLWTMFGIFWAANAILIVAVFNTGELPDEPWITGVIASVGALMCLVWHWVQSRALGNVIKHERLMQRLEKSFIPEPHRTSRSPEEVYNELLGSGAPWYTRGPRARNLISFCSLSAVLIWGLVAVLSWLQVAKMILI